VSLCLLYKIVNIKIQIFINLHYECKIWSLTLRRGLGLRMFGGCWGERSKVKLPEVHTMNGMELSGIMQAKLLHVFDLSIKWGWVICVTPRLKRIFDIRGIKRHGNRGIYIMRVFMICTLRKILWEQSIQEEKDAVRMGGITVRARLWLVSL
jgi:hypothetical protein